MAADTRDLAAPRSAVAQTAEAFGDCSIAIANAGVQSDAPLVEMGDETWSTVIDVNLIRVRVNFPASRQRSSRPARLKRSGSAGKFTRMRMTGSAHTLRAALPGVYEAGHGRVVVIPSTFGRSGSPERTNDCTSKWGLIGLTKAAAPEAGPKGVTVNAVAPTAVRSGLLGGPPEEGTEAFKGMVEALNEYNAIPVGLMAPEDIADGVVFLCTPAAKHISGVCLDVAAGHNAKYTG